MKTIYEDQMVLTGDWINSEIKQDEMCTEPDCFCI